MTSLRTTWTLVAVAALTMGTSACSDDDDVAVVDIVAPTTAADTVPASTAAPVDPVEALNDAVDATLAADAFTIDSLTELSLSGFGDLSLNVDGTIDYAAPAGAIEIAVDSNGEAQNVTMRIGAEHFWFRSPSVENGTWIEGSRSRIASATTFEQSGVLGTILVLRGAETVEVGDTTTIDGENCREYRTTVVYADALGAAGAQAAALESAFSLTGEAASAGLDITTWVGDDGIIRDMSFSIDEELVTGAYDLTLRGVGEPVEPATTPDGEVLRGPDAEAILDQVIV